MKVKELDNLFSDIAKNINEVTCLDNRSIGFKGFVIKMAPDAQNDCVPFWKITVVSNEALVYSFYFNWDRNAMKVGRDYALTFNVLRDRAFEAGMKRSSELKENFISLYCVE